MRRRSSVLRDHTAVRGLRKLSKNLRLGHGSSNLRHLRMQTAVECQFDMWVIRVDRLLELDKLLPHQVMKERKLIEKWDVSMKKVIFLSHQWTSYANPDHTAQQLRAFQQLLVRAAAGKLPVVEPSFADRQAYDTDVKISSAEWQSLARDAVIWIDFISVPRESTRDTAHAVSRRSRSPDTPRARALVSSRRDRSLLPGEQPRCQSGRGAKPTRAAPGAGGL